VVTKNQTPPFLAKIIQKKPNDHQQNKSNKHAGKKMCQKLKCITIFFKEHHESTGNIIMYSIEQHMKHN